MPSTRIHLLRLLAAALLMVAAAALPLTAAGAAPAPAAGCSAEYRHQSHASAAASAAHLKAAGVHSAVHLKAGCCGFGCTLGVPLLPAAAVLPEARRDRVHGFAGRPLAGVDPGGVRRPPKRST